MTITPYRVTVTLVWEPDGTSTVQGFQLDPPLNELELRVFQKWWDRFLGALTPATEQEMTV